MKRRIKRPSEHGYIVLESWMIDYLKLKRDEVIVYAIIHSFSQDGVSQFSGSAKYISYWIGKSEDTVYKLLAKLVRIGLIQKKEVEARNNPYKRYCYYWTTFSRYPPEEQDKAIKNWWKITSEMQ